MPRSFLIKKKQVPVTVKTPLVVKRPWSSELGTKVDTPLTELPIQDNISSDSKGPFDLSIKSARISDQQDEVSNDSKSITPPLGIALISSKFGDGLKPESPGNPAMWHHRPIVPPYLPFNFPLYPFARQPTSNMYGHPGSQNYLVSPPLVPVSPPRATVLRPEQLSPCMPSRDSVSPSYYSGHSDSHSPPQQLATLHMESARKEVYSSMWPMDGKDRHYGAASLSPSPSSDSESGRENSGKGRRSDAPRYPCKDCNKNYSTYSGLSKHRQFHCLTTQNKKSFICKYCEKIYSSLGALKMHIRTHTLPCKCKLCGKAFSRPWLLQGHIRTHTGEKPFSCQHCSRAFADRSNLRAHLQTHSDVKKYSCKACSKTFSRISLLHKHEDGGCSGNQTR